MGVARGLRKAFDQGLGTVAAGAHVFQPGAVGTTGLFSLPRTSVTGVAVTTDRALGYSPFWAGVRVLAETYAQIPLNVMRRLPNGGKEKALDHPLYPVLHDRPNPRTTSFQWRETQMGHLCTWGNSFCAVARDGTGAVRELWPLAPERMSVFVLEDGNPRYAYQPISGTAVEFTRDQLLHVPALAWDGLLGLSPIRYHREAIGLGLATEEHGGRFFANGVTSNFVLSTDGKLSTVALDHLKDQIKDDHTGLNRSWDPWILEEGLKPVTLSMPNDSAQWLETRKHQVHEIARVLNLHPYKLGVAEPGAISYKSVEQFATDFVTNTMLPWYVRGEQALGQQLLGDDWTGNGGDYFVSFEVRGLLRGDTTERYAAYSKAISDGWMNRNEVRAEEDLNLQSGLDEFLVPLNITTVTAMENGGTQTTTTSLTPKPNAEVLLP